MVPYSPTPVELQDNLRIPQDCTMKGDITTERQGTIFFQNSGPLSASGTRGGHLL